MSTPSEETNMFEQSQSGDASTVPTGVRFVDRMLRGGQQVPGVHGLLGATGSGKTTLLTQIAAEGAMAQAALAARGEPSGRWLVVSLEAPRGEIATLARSHIGRIARDSLTSAGIRGMSTTAGSREYEVRRAEELQHEDGSVPREWERLAQADDFIQNHLGIIRIESEDFRRDERPVWTILRCAGAELRQYGSISGIVIDYAGQAVDYAIDASGLLETSQSHYPAMSRMLSEFALDCRNLLAGPHECPVWVAHQLSGAANENRPAANLHHRDAHGCRNFAQHLDTCLILGVQDRRSGEVVMHCTKAPQEPVNGQIRLRFDPDFATMVEAESLENANAISSFDRSVTCMSGVALEHLRRLVQQGARGQTPPPSAGRGRRRKPAKRPK